MKNTVGVIAASALLATGVVGLQAPAQAAPYPDTVTTATSIKAPSTLKSRQTFVIGVYVKAGNASISKGTMRVRWNGKLYVGTVRKSVFRLTLRAPKVTKGTATRTLTAHYVGNKDSVFKDSVSRSVISIKKKTK
ncbi:hypothetical protein ASD11_14050 [Aeromicrobium sp. Root495]|uniref:hypothetical protein n=1 Tax=Aeromicrobium sp. Root495 TaxID=1736550 RepID=UPI0006F7626B|nr:hypothetical protein [Aeromicrobium sp. Root495]KQY60555.1 hypothetical protein ASD11_14050 [Aeromicrobium sp. Root495]